jgi:hypothetical protein
MTANVVVPAPDYTIPVEDPHDLRAVAAVDGKLLISATDYLLINATDKLLIRGVEIGSPALWVPYVDYTIPVPRPEWA